MSENQTICPKCGLECDTMHDDEDNIISTCCYYTLFLVCLTCGGEGIIEEDEYECDWINYGSEIITCPDCQGTGYVTEREWQ